MAHEYKSLEAMRREEAARVKALIERDRADRIREADRKRAEIELANGSFVNIADSVVEPTPEWLAHVPHRSYTPKQPDSTVRVISTVRHDYLSRIMKMHRSGKLSDDHFAACIWYRDRHDMAGLHGRYKSSHISLTGNVGGGGNGAGQSPMALHEREASARVEYRAARAAITQFYVRFFEAVVINDVPLSRASRFARCRNEKAPARFRDCCKELYDFIERNGIDLKGDDDHA